MELRIGVIGTGNIGKTHIDRINTKLQGGKVVAVADDNVEFGLSVAEEYGLKGYVDSEELILSDEIDAVVVCTADKTHKKHVLNCIYEEKYVFVEKPLSPDKEGCKEIVNAEVSKNNQFVQVGFMRRYDQGYVQIKKIIESNEIGSPLMLHCAHRNASAPGFTTPMAVENSLIHEIDVLKWLLDENYKTVEVVFPKKTKNAGPELQDPQVMILTTDSGVRIDIESFLNCRYGYDIQCEVVSEEGTVRLPEPNNAITRINSSIVHPICFSWQQRFIEAYNIEFQSWINACKEKRVDGPNAWDGYLASVTAAAASKARDTQKVVSINFEECPVLYKR